MKWFNGQPVVHGCEDVLHERVPVPVGELCLWCEEVIEAHHSGFMIPHIEGESGKFPEVAWGRPWHTECHIRSVIGSVGHQLRTCSCYGGVSGDPIGATKRDAAIDAYTLFLNQQSCFQSYRERMGGYTG